MKLTILCDNHTYIDRYYLGEPAFSCWIEVEGRRFLFDTGYSDVFLRNARAMDLPLHALDAVIVSHGHNDHTGGLAFLPEALEGRRVDLVACPGVLGERHDHGLSIGCPVSREELERHFALRLSREPVWLTDRLVFLGEIPAREEPRAPVGTDESGRPDLCPDDSALAYAGREGLYLITGCSHSGIRNIAAYAMEVTGRRRILGIVGGMHLMNMDRRALDTIRRLADWQVERVWPCHCTCFDVRSEMARRLSVEEAGVGLHLEWE